MARRILLTPLVAALVLGGCVPSIVDRDALIDDGLTPPGVARNAKGGVDPMIVGDRLLAAGEAELALDSYARAALRDGFTPEIQLAQAAANMQLGRLGQAERNLRTLLQERPDDPRVMNDLGVVLLQQDRDAEAERILKGAFALQPSPEIRGNLRRATAKLQATRYADEEDHQFTLSRKANGTFRLSSPDDT